MAKHSVFNGLKSCINQKFSNVQEACEYLDMAFDIELRDLSFPSSTLDVKTGEPLSIRSPFHYQVVRLDNDAPIWVVGSRYETVPYPKAFSPIDSLLAESSCEIISGGAPNNGERGYLILKTDDEMMISGGGKILNCFVMTSSHDGTGKIEIRMTPYWWEMGTVFSLDATKPLQFKHSKKVYDRINRATAIWNKVSDSWNEFSLATQKIIKVTITDDEAKAFIAKVIGDNDSARMENIREDIYQVFKNTGLACHIPACCGTLFGLVQSICEWGDLRRTVRKSEKRDRIASELDAHLIADTAKRKQKAWAMAMHLSRRKDISGALKQ